MMTDISPSRASAAVPFLDDANAWNGLNAFLQHSGYGNISNLDWEFGTPHRCSLVLSDGQTVTAEGRCPREMACNLLLAVHAYTPGLFEDWESVRKRARLGDYLIKLTWQLGLDERGGVCGLQGIESDYRLAQHFGKVLATREIGPWGPGLGEKRRSTLVEAWVAQRAPVHLADLMRGLVADLVQVGVLEQL